MKFYAFAENSVLRALAAKIRHFCNGLLAAILRRLLERQLGLTSDLRDQKTYFDHFPIGLSKTYSAFSLSTLTATGRLWSPVFRNWIMTSIIERQYSRISE